MNKRVKKVVNKSNGNMKKVINKNKVFYFSVAVIAVIIIAVTSIKFVSDFLVKDEREVKTKQELDNLELYGYTLDDADTELYKTYFDELKEVLNEEDVDMDKYAEGLTKLFIVDFYTLDNKITSSDIGGIEFLHPDIVENFKLKAGDTMYNHVKNNVYDDRVQELPVVSNVNITECVSEPYIYGGNSYDGYKVTASWEYEKDLGYDKEGVFYLIKDNNKLNIVQK